MILKISSSGKRQRIQGGEITGGNQQGIRITEVQEHRYGGAYVSLTHTGKSACATKAATKKPATADPSPRKARARFGMTDGSEGTAKIDRQFTVKMPAAAGKPALAQEAKSTAKGKG